MKSIVKVWQNIWVAKLQMGTVDHMANYPMTDVLALIQGRPSGQDHDLGPINFFCRVSSYRTLLQLYSGSSQVDGGIDPLELVVVRVSQSERLSY